MPNYLYLGARVLRVDQGRKPGDNSIRPIAGAGSWLRPAGISMLRLTALGVGIAMLAWAVGP